MGFLVPASGLLEPVPDGGTVFGLFIACSNLILAPPCRRNSGSGARRAERKLRAESPALRRDLGARARTPHRVRSPDRRVSRFRSPVRTATLSGDDAGGPQQGLRHWIARRVSWEERDSRLTRSVARRAVSISGRERSRWNPREPATPAVQRDYSGKLSRPCCRPVSGAIAAGTFRNRELNRCSPAPAVCRSTTSPFASPAQRDPNGESEPTHSAAEKICG